MNAQEFLAKNKLVSCKQLAELLEVSSGTVTKMKTSPSRVQSLALEALHNQQREANLIEIDVTEWFDGHGGNTYFSAWVYFKGEHHFLPFQYGYGSHVEDVALKMLFDKGLLPNEWRRYVLSTEYNVTIHTNKAEVKKSDMFNGEEY